MKENILRRARTQNEIINLHCEDRERTNEMNQSRNEKVLNGAPTLQYKIQISENI